MDAVEAILPVQLAAMVRGSEKQALIVDARTFCEFNTCHVYNSINVWCSKLRKKRLQQNVISVSDYLQQACQVGLQASSVENVAVYDQNCQNSSAIPQDSFLFVLLQKLTPVFKNVSLLSGGFLEFQATYPELCEDSSQKMTSLTSISQPCMPVAKSGPTRILPFLFLGSQYDANNKQMLLEHNVLYELNVSTSCAKPEFMQETHFLRIPVNDSFSEKLLPHFGEAFHFIDKVREAGGRVLVHCLAGISRSPTVAIAYVMKHLRLHYDEAYRYVKNRRPTISPNINFVGQLLELDRQLLGEGSLYRSPTAPLYLEYDSSFCADLLPSPESLILKSSSSSCLNDNKKEFPFSPKRSLPTLKFQDSTESSQSPLASPDSTTDSPSLSFIASMHKEQQYTSNRLPSSPVSTPPCSPECFDSYSLCACKPEIECSNDQSKHTTCLGRVSPMNCDHVKKPNGDLFKGRKIYRTVSSDGKPQLVTKDKSLNVEKTNNTNASRYGNPAKTQNKENFSTTAVININSPEELPGGEDDTTRRKSVCVIEVTHDKSPFTFIHANPTPMVIRETTVIATPYSEEDASAMAQQNKNCGDKSIYLPATKSKPPIAAAPQSNEKACATSTSSAPHSLPKLQATTSFPLKRAEPKHLPRSYSSSETHLNTRRLLESHSGSTAESGTRKSFSTDEVSRAWSQHSSPQTPHTPHANASFPREEAMLLMSPSDLARCDSWSTSGLGSEISDIDSLQGDSHSVLLDDPMGPYDAVFADFYPGEASEPLSRDPCIRQLSSCNDQEDEKQGTFPLDQKHSKATKKPPQCPSQTSSHKIQTSSSKEALGGSTPRPISLPGVTGTYNALSKSQSDQSSSIDMGVDMDESPDWQNEKGQESIKCDALKNSSKLGIIEHPPVSQRTMGEEVKHMMTWFKIEPWPQASCPPPTDTRLNIGENNHPKLLNDDSKPCSQNKHTNTPCKECPPIDPEKRSPSTEDEEKGVSEEVLTKQSEGIPDLGTSKKELQDDLSPEESSNNAHVGKKEFGSLEERLHWWDNEFKRKIRNIQQNVSLKSWDPAHDDAVDDDENLPTKSSKLAGIHLAEELMQSMEDLLENEISSIKRQANVLRTRFGLNVPTASDYRETRDDSKSLNVTFGSCIQSPNANPFLKNANRASIHLPISYSDINSNGHIQSLRAIKEKLNANCSAQSSRAKSEPPLCNEEGLYRVRSCPGLQGKPETHPNDTTKKEIVYVTLRSRPSKVKKEPNRYSCGALDFIPPTLPSFESCPDISKLRLVLLDKASNSSGTSCSSPHSSSRLLPVS